MGISEETAALVAAQLTTAWAIKTGVTPPDPARPAETQVTNMYTRYKRLAQQG